MGGTGWTFLRRKMIIFQDFQFSGKNLVNKDNNCCSKDSYESRNKYNSRVNNRNENNKKTDISHDCKTPYVTNVNNRFHIKCCIQFKTCGTNYYWVRFIKKIPFYFSEMLKCELLREK